MQLQELITHQRIQKGDVAAFETIFRKYYAQLCRYARQFVKDSETAEEIVQDLFYHYWKDRSEINVHFSLKNYLFRSVRNKALKHLDQIAVRNRYAAEKLTGMTNAEPFTQAEWTTTRELQRVVNKTLESLPERTRTIFIMNRFEGMTYRQIAETLSISVKTVEANMSKALLALKDKLGS